MNNSAFQLTLATTSDYKNTPRIKRNITVMLHPATADSSVKQGILTNTFSTVEHSVKYRTFQNSGIGKASEEDVATVAVQINNLLLNIDNRINLIEERGKQHDKHVSELQNIIDKNIETFDKWAASLQGN